MSSEFAESYSPGGFVSNAITFIETGLHGDLVTNIPRIPDPVTRNQTTTAHVEKFKIRVPQASLTPHGKWSKFRSIKKQASKHRTEQSIVLQLAGHKITAQLPKIFTCMSGMSKHMYNIIRSWVHRTPYHFPTAVVMVCSDVLDKSREPLVQPKVVPPLHRHDVAEPLPGEREIP